MSFVLYISITVHPFHPPVFTWSLVHEDRSLLRPALRQHDSLLVMAGGLGAGDPLARLDEHHRVLALDRGA